MYLSTHMEQFLAVENFTLSSPVAIKPFALEKRANSEAVKICF